MNGFVDLGEARSRRVVITGSGVICPLADQAEDLHAALCAGRSGLRPTTFEELPEMGSHLTGSIDFEPRTYLPDGKLRPLDRVARLVISAARLALDNAGLDDGECEKTEVGLVLGTMYCSLRTIVAFDQRALAAGPKYVRPFDFANTVINAAAGQTAIWHRLRGVNSTLAGGTAAGLEALAYAVDLIRSGRSDVVLAGGGDELCFESFLSFQRSGQLCDSDTAQPRPIPFDPRRNGFALSEGAALLVLESAEHAEARGASVLGEVLGHASGFDPSRGRNPAAAVQHVARTLGLALADAGVHADAIDSVSASANGCPRHDAHEAQALAQVFKTRHRPLPVSAVKSMLGESLGASGALQSLSLLQSLRHQEIPGIPGFEPNAPEPLGPLSVSNEARPLELHKGLVSAVGLDGNICGLVMAAGEAAA